METTGPKMLHNTFTKYRILKYAGLPDVADPEIFQPIADPRRIHRFKKECGQLWRLGFNIKQAKNICYAYLSGNKTTEKTLTVHHWTHSWISGMETDEFGFNNDNSTFNIKDLHQDS